jgi:hypothetical protein
VSGYESVCIVEKGGGVNLKKDGSSLLEEPFLFLKTPGRAAASGSFIRKYRYFRMESNDDGYVFHN